MAKEMRNFFRALKYGAAYAARVSVTGSTSRPNIA